MRKHLKNKFKRKVIKIISFIIAIGWCTSYSNTIKSTQLISNNDVLGSALNQTDLRFYGANPAIGFDDEFIIFQELMLENPKAGDVIKGTGGLRKIRFSQPSRGKGKRGGVRIIYYWFTELEQFYLATIYNKGEMADLSNDEKRLLKNKIEVWKNETKKKPI